MKDLLFFSETFAKMNRFHYNKGKSFAKKIGRRIMKKIDAHLHLVRDLAALQDIAGEQTYPYPFCQEAVGLAKEIVGAKRLLWGSDAPWSATFNDYGQLYSWLEDAGIFSEAELADVYYGNAERIYFKADHVAALKASRDPLFEGDA